MKLFFCALFIVYACQTSNRNTLLSPNIFNDKLEDIPVELKLSNAAKQSLQTQALRFLRYSGGENITGSVKYIYEGTFKSVSAQNGDLSENKIEAKKYIVKGLKYSLKQAEKLNLKFKYHFYKFEKAISIRDNFLGGLKIITIAYNKKYQAIDTTFVLGISKNKGKDWTFIDKRNCADALSYEFSFKQVDKIINTIQ
jgi:hypothetical protein